MFDPIGHLSLAIASYTGIEDDTVMMFLFGIFVWTAQIWTEKQSK